MPQRSITNKMRVKWALNPKALPTNFLYAAHHVGFTSFLLPLILFLFCSPASTVYQSFRWLMSQIDSWCCVRLCAKERDRMLECLLKCLLLQLETGWCLNCLIYTSLWPRRQVFPAWTLPLYTNKHMHFSDKREKNLPASQRSWILIPVCFFFWHWSVNKLSSKYRMENRLRAFHAFVQHGIILYILEQFVQRSLSAAYVSVERAPICHWAACTSAKQYLVSGFNYRFACVCIYMWLTKVGVFCSPSYPLWTIHLLPLSPLSFPFCFFCHLVTCTVECLTLVNTHKMLCLPVGGKSFLTAMSLTW